MSLVIRTQKTHKNFCSVYFSIFFVACFFCKQILKTNPICPIFLHSFSPSLYSSISLLISFSPSSAASTRALSLSRSLSLHFGNFKSLIDAWNNGSKRLIWEHVGLAVQTFLLDMYTRSVVVVYTFVVVAAVMMVASSFWRISCWLFDLFPLWSCYCTIVTAIKSISFVWHGATMMLIGDVHAVHLLAQCWHWWWCCCYRSLNRCLNHLHCSIHCDSVWNCMHDNWRPYAVCTVYWLYSRCDQQIEPMSMNTIRLMNCAYPRHHFVKNTAHHLIDVQNGGSAYQRIRYFSRDKLTATRAIHFWIYCYQRLEFQWKLHEPHPFWFV